MAPESPPCHLHTIKTVWASVEPFLDLQSTVRASQTCRSLHEDLVDAETQKIKVSHFPGWSIFEPDTPWGRIPYYLPSALNVVHFPSLRKIDMNFPNIKLSGEGSEEIEDAAASCFPIFVAHLACARNLEGLSLDMSSVLIDDNSLRLEPLIQLFGRNLARCKRLSELIIYRSIPHEYCTYLMKETLLALAPVLRQQKNVLRTVVMGFEGSPVPTNTNPSEELPSAATDFFGAILECSDLERLSINVQHSITLTDGLLEATRQKCSSKNYSPLGSCLRLRRLNISVDLGMTSEPLRMERDQDQYLESARMLFEHFLHCEQLQDVCFGLPLDIWDAHIDTIAKMLCDKPQLSKFDFFFCGYADDDDKAIDLLESCGSPNNLQVHELKKVNGRRLFQLLERAKNCGRHVDLNGVAHVAPGDEEAEGDAVEEREVGADTLQEDMPEKVDIEFLWL